MEPKEFLAFLGRLEKLKCNTRHSWTSTGRHETVAAHSWRLAVMALLLKNELPGVDMDKVLRMCLLHDIGEAVTGDIPSFEKTEDNEETERQAIAGLLAPLPDGLRGELTELFAEMDALATPEARVYKAGAEPDLRHPRGRPLPAPGRPAGAGPAGHPGQAGTEGQLRKYDGPRHAPGASACRKSLFDRLLNFLKLQKRFQKVV